MFCEEVRGRAHAWLNHQYLVYASSIQLRSAGCSAVRLHPKPTTQRGTGNREETHTLNLFDLNYMPPLRIYLVIVVSLMSSVLWVHEPDVRGAKGLSGDSLKYAPDSYCLLEYLQCPSLWCSSDYEGSFDGAWYPLLVTSEGLR